MNAHDVGEVALAGATSNLFATLADSYRRSKRVKPGDEIIIHDSSHEVPSGIHTHSTAFHTTTIVINHSAPLRCMLFQPCISGKSSVLSAMHCLYIL